MCNGEQRVAFNRAGHGVEEIDVSKGIRGFGVFVAVPVEALMPQVVFLCIEEEKIVVAALDAEGEDDKDRIGKPFGNFDFDGKVCSINAVLPVGIFVAVGLFGVEKRSKF